MKKLLPLMIGLTLGAISTMSQAADLLEVYQHAKESNPELRKAAAERNAAFEKINEARSPLLPQIGLNASYGYSSVYGDAKTSQSGYKETTQATASLGLSQVLFDLTKFRQLSLQEKTAGLQDVSFRGAEQKLMIDTATAYFNVLRAVDALSYTEAQKQTVYRQLDQTQQRFKVGLVAITDVQNARANYDSVLASEVMARNTLNNALEDLRQQSGISYEQLSAISVENFKPKQPEGVEESLKQAEQANLSLLGARLSQDLAREQVKVARSGHAPTLTFNASTGWTQNDYHFQPANGLPNDRNNDGQNAVGVTLNVPLYAGGKVNSMVEQAKYGFIGASENLELEHRKMTQNINSSFNNISAAVSGVAAYQQVVVSAQSALKATEAGYRVGTRTIVDVLNATSVLYNAKQQLSSARYDYLISQLAIKAYVGTLNLNDLMALNSALGKPVATAPDAVILATQATSKKK